MSLGRFEVAARRIDTREELIDALAIAAELEQSLLVQYLFAAYSLRKRPGRGLDERQVELVRDWEAVLLAVAREEMVHFATVTKVAVAVGGAPHLTRPSFPQPAGTAFPFDLRLHRFALEELDRFIRFETPAESPEARALGIAPDLVEYRYLGELYGQIRAALVLLAETKGEDWLFVGPADLRPAEDWGLNHEVRGIADAASAVAAIDEVIVEGEGGPTDVEDSHWQRFRGVRAALGDELVADPDFEPAHPVVANPLTRRHPSGLGGTVLDGKAREVAELFNHLYATLLLLIGQFYAPAGETARQRDEIQATVRRSMSAILRPIAEILTELPAGATAARGCAGAPFEIYGPLELASTATARWAVLDERLERAAGEAARLARDRGVRRLRFIAENVALMRDAIERTAAGEEVGLARPRV